MGKSGEGDFVSGYAQEDEFEDFAESFWLLLSLEGRFAVQEVW